MDERSAFSYGFGPRRISTDTIDDGSFQLSFYRNMTIHLFILPALVSAAMYTRVKQGGAPSHQRISYADLYEQVAFLSQLFRGEFIFPTEGLATNLDKTLRSLEADRVIKVTRVEREDANEREGAPVQWVELSDEERERGRENYDFYCFMIWPFVEASWLGAVSLMMLTPPPPEKSKAKDTTATSTTTNANPWLDQKKVQDRAQLLGKTLYHQGDLSYFEAVNKETLKNAYTRFEEDGIVAVSRSRDSRVPPTLRLADDWVPSRDPATGHILPKGRLWDFAEMISQSRREGKNRRDGKTVVGRVLGLVEKVGAQLFVDGAVAGSTKVLEEAKVAEVGVSAKQKGEALERAEEEAAAVAESERRKRRRKSIQTRARL